MDLAALLDDISSNRSSISRRGRALTSIEYELGTACTLEADSNKLSEFLRCQDAFETNVASRIVAAISSWLPVLQGILVTAGDSKVAENDESSRMTDNIIQCLSILQGVSLLHKPSKKFLCRRWCLELLLDLLVLSKYLNHHEGAQKSPNQPTPTFLASAVLDTLLCILVDVPEALRLFEELDGLEALVRTLKRPGVPQETRMKCLEFLYFYLLPEEDESSAEVSQAVDLSASQTSDTSDNDFAPNPKVTELRLLRNDLDFTPTTPIKQKKRAGIGAHAISTPKSSSRHSRGIHDDDPLSNTPSRSNGRTRGMSEITLVPSSSSGSLIESGDDVPRTPIKLLRHRSSASPSKGSDSDAPLDRVRTPQRKHLREPSYTDNTLVNNPFEETTPKPARQKMPFPAFLPPKNAAREGAKSLRTTDEKTQLLAKHLGNVHALVEGMKQTGVWGLH